MILYLDLEGPRGVLYPGPPPPFSTHGRTVPDGCPEWDDTGRATPGPPLHTRFVATAA